jgi:hypothetical protein
MANKMQSER